MNEDKYDDLEVIYFQLDCGLLQNLSASPAITHKASNSHPKPLSRNSLYLGLSEANQRAIAALELSVDASTEEVLEQLLFAQVAGQVVVVE